MEEPARTKEFLNIVYYAIQRWQTLAFILLICVLIAASIVFLGFDLLEIILLVLIGLAGTAGLVYVHFKDTEAVEEARLAHVEPTLLKTDKMRNAIHRAKAYQISIQRTIRRVRSEELKDGLQLIANGMPELSQLLTNTIADLEKLVAQSVSDQMAGVPPAGPPGVAPPMGAPPPGMGGAPGGMPPGMPPQGMMPPGV